MNLAIENQINTHWAFGMIGLPAWLMTNARTINTIFQIRSNATEEIIYIAREHLRRNHLKPKADSELFQEDLDRELQPTQVKMSLKLVDPYAARHMAIFTKEVSECCEWLISHQPTITETISMRPDSTRWDQAEICSNYW